MRQVVFLLTCVMGVVGLSGCVGSKAAGKDVSKVDVGSTTLFEAAKDPAATDKLAALITSGADLNAQDEAGMTPLHYTAAANNGDAVKRLIWAKADLRIKDAKGRTAEDVAAQGRNANALRAFERLVR